MKNLTEFKALIIRYETITIEEIQKAGCNTDILTGFSHHGTCSLCLAVNKAGFNTNCTKCVYYAVNRTQGACYKGAQDKSYYAISFAETSEQILKAYWLRAKHMRGILKQLNIEF